jgi:hypothetical protein
VFFTGENTLPKYMTATSMTDTDCKNQTSRQRRLCAAGRTGGSAARNQKSEKVLGTPGMQALRPFQHRRIGVRMRRIVYLKKQISNKRVDEIVRQIDKSERRRLDISVPNLTVKLSRSCRAPSSGKLLENPETRLA